ncbi:MAG: HAD-IIA family hydrolase [Candidatus Hodarchaeota archaeon]
MKICPAANNEIIHPFLHTKKLFLFDLDGVIWRGQKAIPGAQSFLEALEKSGKLIAYITNNSTKTKEQYIAKLRSFNIQATAEQIYTSAYATAELLKKWGKKTAYVVGGDGIRDALQQVGIEINSFFSDEPPDAVVVGMDVNFTYATLRTAMRAILSGADFVGTNPDTSFPAEDGISPGAGTMIAAISTGVGFSPKIVVGKPNPEMLLQAMELFNVSPENTVMIGDRLSTDIASGINANTATVRVMTGVKDHSELITPDLQVDSIRDLLVSKRR